jgi:filamentous hemagglutinin family protein
MNSMRYRVVFNASLATWVAVAENVAARGKPSRGRARKLVGAALSVSIAGTAMLAGAADLVRPVASTLSNQTATNIGVKSIVQSSTLTTVTQDKATAVQNWASFNVGTDHAVKFVQPDSNSRILNRIWDNDPSYINGRIDANGQVYLVNRNGIQFGKDSQINVGSLIASALNIKVKTFEDGYLSLGGKDEAAFYYAGTLDDFDAPTSDVSAVTGKDVAVRNYGSIKAADGGSIMLFAPRVENAGSIQANGGQVVLAAGAKVYLAASRDAALRGVLVEVDPFVGGNKDSSTVSNSGLKEAMQGIIADRGNITLAAMAVNNNGLLQASSGKTLNGSIYLQGRSGVTQAVVVEGTATAPAVLEPLAQQGGEVVLGANSRIEAPIDSISEADVKAQALAQYVPQAGDSAAVQASRLAALEDLIRNQYSVSRAESIASPVKSSQIRIDGRQVLLQSGSSITAPHADVSITAQGTRGVDIVRVSDDAARVVMEQGASIDVSGYQNVAVDGSRNQISATLVSNELADSPLQRDGVLYRKTVEFNLLDVPTGKMAIANASGAVDAVRLSLQEVAATGGTVSVKSQGDVVIGTGASINVSGGSVKYSDAVIETTLLTAGTQRVEIGKASADVVYSGLSTGRKTVSAYVEGKAAGTLTVAADNKMVLDGTLRGNAQAGLYQTTAQTAPKGGTLVIGDAAVAGRAISFQRGSGLGATSPFWADPLNAVVDDGSLNIVTPDIFTNGGFTQATIMATGISVAAGTDFQGQRYQSQSCCGQDDRCQRHVDKRCTGGVRQTGALRRDPSGRWRLR